MKLDFKLKNLFDNGDESENWSLNSFDDVGSIHGDSRSFTALDSSRGDNVDDVAIGGKEDGDWVAGQGVDPKR
ncbi:hypothetical protein SLA2020_035540 [Shorea laevis]